MWLFIIPYKTYGLAIVARLNYYTFMNLALKLLPDVAQLLYFCFKRCLQHKSSSYFRGLLLLF